MFMMTLLILYQYIFFKKSVLDISDNKIEDEDVLEKVFIHMPNLAVLYLHGNPCVKKISNYRKKFIYTLKSLKFLVSYF